MPAKYEAILTSLAKSNPKMPMKEKKQIAAATYNKQRKTGQKPVTRYSDK